MVAWVFDADRTLPQVQQRLQGARLSAVANRQGFGALSAEEAQLLAQRGVDVEQAQRAFAVLGGELGRALPGEAGFDFTRQEQLAAVAGDAGALDEQERIRRRRQGEFEAGGSFAGGVAGIGSAE